MAKTIDPIYKKYAAKVVSSVASTEFYDYFMSVLKAGKNSFQFSNRRIEKTVDETWVAAIEAVIKPMGEIINNPRNFIKREEVIVNVALAKKVTPESVRHLATHGSMVDEVTADSVRPNRLLEQTREDSWDTYENKFVYTLLDMTWDFVDKRYEAIFSALGEEYGAHLIMKSDAASYNENMTVNVDIRVRQQDDILSADEKNETIFSRIARLHRILGTYKSSLFAKTVSKFGKIKPPIVLTNAIKKNPNYKACHKLWNFILAYDDIGYKIEIYDQNPEIDAQFEQDIYNSILFDYIILKNYLESTEDRAIDTSRAFKKKELKPKYVKEIVEEIVNNYDLPDVEIRKVLIEELTKAQLMQEEEKERLRLVEEKEKEMEAKRKEEEKERKRKEKEELKERMRQQREAEKEAARQEKARLAEEARLAKEEEKRKEEEARNIELFRAELERAAAERQACIDGRIAAEAAAAKKAEEDAAREAQREKERLAKEKAREKERLAKEKAKEKERLAREKAKEKEKLAKEKEKLAKEKAKEKAKDKAKAKPAPKKGVAAKAETAEKKQENIPEIIPQTEEIKPVDIAPEQEIKAAEIPVSAEEIKAVEAPVSEVESKVEKVEDVAEPAEEMPVFEAADTFEEETREAEAAPLEDTEAEPENLEISTPEEPAAETSEAQEDTAETENEDGGDGKKKRRKGFFSNLFRTF